VGSPVRDARLRGQGSGGSRSSPERGDMRVPRLAALTALAVGLLGLTASASAEHATRPHSQSMHALGHSPHATSFEGVAPAQQNVNSDIAFWGDLVFNGNYDGFRIIRLTSDGPQE